MAREINLHLPTHFKAASDQRQTCTVHHISLVAIGVFRSLLYCPGWYTVTQFVKGGMGQWQGKEKINSLFQIIPDVS